MEATKPRNRGGTRRICLPRHWPWFGLVAVLPFVGAAIVLEFVAPNILKVETAFAEGAGAAIGHIGDRLTYAALAYVQLTTCLLVISFYVLRLFRLDRARRAGALRLLGVTALCAAVAVVVVRSLQGAAYAVTYLNIRDLLARTDVSKGLTTPLFSVEGIPYLVDVTPISIVGGVPFLMGVIAVVLAVPVGAAAASFPENEPEDWTREFAERVQWLQNSFYALSIVLVTSTVAIMLFFQLPAEIAVGGGREGLLRYARGLTVFWGATMTLTLLASFAPAMLALRQRAREQHGAVASRRDFGEWFAEQVPITARRQVANLATMLAPLMVGPLGGLLQAMFGSA